MKLPLKDALWADCETDLERADFLRMGRGWETGIIASSLQHEFAMAFEFRGQIMKDRASSPPAPDPRDALIEKMGEALKAIKAEKIPGYHDCIDDGLDKCAWCYALEALSAWQKFKEGK